MEPDVIRIYSSSPPPMEDEDEDDEFSDFTGVPNSVSLTEFETPITFDQSQALNSTSPPELLSNGRVVGLSHTIKLNGVKHGSGQIDTQDGRTVSVEELKMLSEHHPHVNSTEIASGSMHRTNRDECNGSVEGQTNGLGGSPSPLHKNGKLEPCRDQQSDEHTDVYNFADFSSFSNTDHNQLLNSNWEQNVEECSPSQDDTGIRCPAENRCTDANRDSVISATDFPSDALSNGDCRNHAGSDLNRDLDNDCVVLDSPEPVSTAQCQAINGEVVQSGAEDENDRLDAAQSDDKVSENETETETETSLGRLLSTDALEEFGDFSLTGSVPSPQLQEDMVSPGDQSQLAEYDNDEDFGDFGDAASFGAAGFADFDQQEQTKNEGLSDFPEGSSNTELVSDEATTSAFPGSDSFADFQVVDNKEQWEAFSEPAQIQSEGESWASFGQEPDQRDVQEERKTSLGQDVCKTALLVSRLEKIFQGSFELVLARQVEEQVLALKSFIQPLEPSERKDGDRETTSRASDVQDVWQKLHDVNNSVGLRYQWGGSHTNKALLGSLGIDTRNILFTGQRKQPVIVPMYAASLGMLEPTKEPVKLVSAAEIIASIALSPSVSTELKDCPADHTQESLPPVQFDWSSSGLTNPLDASGGSSCLNLDFFGPVDESPSGSATSMPGVDPELYELTQAKMEGSGSGSRVVVDAFARLMSTVEKTSTSTRRPAQREENLSEEAEQVIAGLPDLSFMQAKVLMFPSTLTPLQPRD